MILTTAQLHELAHPPEVCEGEYCTVHNPSAHHMRDWPINWRIDRALPERICRHGVGHPDPDHIEFVRRVRGDEAAAVESVHGCCGCCRGGL